MPPNVPTIDELIPGAMLKGLEKYPHLFPPPGFIQVDRNGLLAPTDGSGIPQVLETILLTSGYSGWLRTVGLESGDWATSYMTLSVGGSPLRDYTKIMVPLGSPTTPKAVFIELVPNQPLTLTVTSTALVPVRWSLWGWYYPSQGGR